MIMKTLGKVKWNNIKDLFGFSICASCKKKETIDYEDIGEGKYCQDCLDKENKIWEDEAGFKEE